MNFQMEEEEVKELEFKHDEESENDRNSDNDGDGDNNDCENSNNSVGDDSNNNVEGKMGTTRTRMRNFNGSEKEKIPWEGRRYKTITTKIGTVLNYHYKDVTLDQVTIKGSSATCVKSLIEQIVQAMSRGRHSVSILAQALVSFHMTDKKYEKKSIKVDTSFYLQCINFYFRSPS